MRPFVVQGTPKSTVFQQMIHTKMGLMSLVILCAAMCMILLSPAVLNFSTWYVSFDGSGTACTQTAPCASINQAYHNAKPGDVILLAAGHYPVQTVNAKGGASSSDIPITVRPTSPASVILQGIVAKSPAVTYSGLTIDATASGYCSGCGFYTAASARADQLLDSLLVNATITINASSVAVNNNAIGPSIDHDGIDVADRSTGVVITKNYIHDLTVDAVNPQKVHVDCVQMYDTSNVLVAQNRLANCVDRAIIFSSGQGYGVTNATIENNFIQGCADISPCQGSGIAVDARTGGPGFWTLDHLVFRANTVVPLASGGVLIDPANPRMLYADNIIGHIQGNCFSGAHNLIASYDRSICHDDSWITNGSILAPLPKFNDRSIDDLHITSSAPPLLFADNNVPLKDYDDLVRCQPTYVGADDPCAGSRAGRTTAAETLWPLFNARSATGHQQRGESAAVPFIILAGVVAIVAAALWRRSRRPIA